MANYGEDQTDVCPNYGSTHKFFVYKVLDVYETTDVYDDGGQLYKKVQYAYQGCNCGESCKTVVKVR